MTFRSLLAISLFIITFIITILGLLSPFAPHGPREREANLYLRKRLYPLVEAAIWNNMGNRITNCFRDPINGCLILFAPIRHLALFRGSEVSFAVSDPPGRVLRSGSLRLGKHAEVH